MRTYKTTTSYNNDSGIALVPFLLFAAVVALLLTAAMQMSASSTRTVYAAKLRSERYYESESGVNIALSWIRNNSQSLVSQFRAAEFYNNFHRTTPSYGVNDTGNVQVPTKIKLKDTNNSAILTNSLELATSAFPATSNIKTGAGFDAISQFAATNFGSALLKVTLVDALPLDPTKDAPPLAIPETDFYPVYRIDAVTDSDRGAHLYGYIIGSLYYVDIIGFYGRDYVDVRQDCTSAIFTGANAGPTNAKCPVGSNGLISIANNAEIYGSARTNGSISDINKVCGDYPSCTTRGKTCQGESCSVPGLPTFKTWEEYCPVGSSHGDYTIAANQNKILITAGCYETVTINNKGSLTLQTTGTPYYFKTLTVSGGNAQTQLKIAPLPNTGTVELYVQTITGDNVNGNQTINPSYRPSQFRIYYLGTNDLKLNGNSPMALALVAPYANVEVLGNADFKGGIIAKGLKLSGSATIVYDETLGGTTLSDMNLRFRGLEEGYK